MRELIALVGVVLLVGVALAAEATPLVRDDAQDGAFPGERLIEVQGQAAIFGGSLQEPEITTSAYWITAFPLDGSQGSVTRTRTLLQSLVGGSNPPGPGRLSTSLPQESSRLAWHAAS